MCTCAFGVTWFHLAGCWDDTGLRKGQQAGWGGQPGLWAGRPQKGLCQLEAAGSHRDEGSGPLGGQAPKTPGTTPLMGPLAEPVPLQRPDPSTGKAWEVPGQLRGRDGAGCGWHLRS